MEFKVGDEVIVGTKNFLEDIKNPIATIIEVDGNVAWVTNKQVEESYPEDARFSVWTNELRLATPLDKLTKVYQLTN